MQTLHIQAKELYSQGNSLEAIASELNCSMRTVRQAAQELRKQNSLPMQTLHIQAKELYSQGNSLEAIASELNCSMRTVRRATQELRKPELLTSDLRKAAAQSIIHEKATVKDLCKPYRLGVEAFLKAIEKEFEEAVADIKSQVLEARACNLTRAEIAELLDISVEMVRVFVPIKPKHKPRLSAFDKAVYAYHLENPELSKAQLAIAFSCPVKRIFTAIIKGKSA